MLYDASLDQLEARCGTDFVRAHRSHLVNLRHVVRLISTDAEWRKLELTGGLTVPVSRRRYGVVEERVRALTSAS